MQERQKDWSDGKDERILRNHPSHRSNPSALVGRLALAAFVVALAASPAGAQALRGAVVDSATRAPLAGAVLELLDAAGARLGRGITNERGEYRVALAAAARQVRVLRLGFRPREIALPASPNGAEPLNVAMVRVPAFLEAVRVTAAPNCPRRSDGVAALALWEQARAGLLTAVVAREATPGAMKLLGYDRDLDDGGQRVLRQRVRIDSSDGRTRSFEAAQRAADFVRRGFTRDSAGFVEFLGPDADVLLDDAFASAYCFQVAAPHRERPNEVGVAFAPARRRTGRVDIEGALWIDTVARAVRVVDFRWVGLPRRVEAMGVGGRVSFRDVPNGIVFVDRWSFRLVGAVQDTTVDARGRARVDERLYAREVGGQVARATWPDGHAWRAPLGTLRLQVTDAAGKPEPNVVIRLADTDYLATPTSNGIAEIPDLVPGPYSILVIDAALARMGMALGSSRSFVADGDSVVRATVVAPDPAAVVAVSCKAHRATTRVARYGVPVSTRSEVRGRVLAHDGSPVADAMWELGEDLGNAGMQVAVSGRVADDGSFRLCPVFTPGHELQIRARRTGDPAWSSIVLLVPNARPFDLRLPR